MKDKCPSCGHRFGLRGAPFRIPAKEGDSRKPVYYCGACGIRLKRIVPASERLASVIGCMALLIASSISLWQITTLSQVVDRDWLPILYGVCVIGIGVPLSLSSALYVRCRWMTVQIHGGFLRIVLQGEKHMHPGLPEPFEDLGNSETVCQKLAMHTPKVAPTLVTAVQAHCTNQ